MFHIFPNTSVILNFKPTVVHLVITFCCHWFFSGYLWNCLFRSVLLSMHNLSASFSHFFPLMFVFFLLVFTNDSRLWSMSITGVESNLFLSVPFEYFEYFWAFHSCIGILRLNMIDQSLVWWFAVFFSFFYVVGETFLILKSWVDFLVLSQLGKLHGIVFLSNMLPC